MNRSRALALILIVVSVACREQRDIAKEPALKDNLTSIRRAIGNFRKDNGRYPYSLDELVPNYIRRIPADPMTGSKTWRPVTEDTVQPSSDFTTGTAAAPRSVIIDVQSAAPGADANGVLYSNY
ncbi:MAG TPA: type II secretion system protein G [Thermoanaerobaculia bacterium]